MSIYCLYRKAVKATLVLLPLLGITYMLFFVNPGEDDISQIVFIYFNSFLQSFQVRIILSYRVSIAKKYKTYTCESVFIAELYHAFESLLSSLVGGSFQSRLLLCLQCLHPSSPYALCSQLSRLAGQCELDFCPLAFTFCGIYFYYL